MHTNISASFSSPDELEFMVEYSSILLDLLLRGREGLSGTRRCSDGSLLLGYEFPAVGVPRGLEWALSASMHGCIKLQVP